MGEGLLLRLQQPMALLTQAAVVAAVTILLAAQAVLALLLSLIQQVL
jgi:hypothetical protein